MGREGDDPDFKREAVRLVVEEGLSVREVERNLGITFGVVKGWVQKQRDHQDAAFVGRVAPNSPEGSRAEAMAGSFYERGWNPNR